MVTSGYLRLPVVTRSYQWLLTVTSGYLWLPVVTRGYQWLLVVTSGYTWLLVCGYSSVRAYS